MLFSNLFESCGEGERQQKEGGSAGRQPPYYFFDISTLLHVQPAMFVLFNYYTKHCDEKKLNSILVILAIMLP